MTEIKFDGREEVTCDFDYLEVGNPAIFMTKRETCARVSELDDVGKRLATFDDLKRDTCDLDDTVGRTWKLDGLVGGVPYI